MKRILSLITLFALCMALLSCAAFAEDFVPSIGGKDHPAIVPESSTVIGHIVNSDNAVIDEVEKECIVVTPVSEANTSKDIPEAAREELLKVYAALKNGEMDLPYEEALAVSKSAPRTENSANGAEHMVIRDLFDVSFLCEEHPEMMANGYKLRLTFDLGISSGDTVCCMVYTDGKWSPVEMFNNGNGTVTCLFSKVCPVVFASKQTETPPDTGDYSSNSIALWGAVMAVSAVAFGAAIVIYRKKVAKAD